MLTLLLSLNIFPACTTLKKAKQQSRYGKNVYILLWIVFCNRAIIDSRQSKQLKPVTATVQLITAMVTLITAMVQPVNATVTLITWMLQPVNATVNSMVKLITGTMRSVNVTVKRQKEV